MSFLFDAIIEKAQEMGLVGVGVVEAADGAILSALSAAEKEGFVKPYLIGNRRKIEAVMAEKSISFKDATFVESDNPEKSSRLGINLVREKAASILMKGKITTPMLLRAVLDKENGLRTGRILSHVACLKVPGFDRFIFVTDGGVVLSPDLEKKIEIIKNAIQVAKVLGVDTPKIACLAPSEIPSVDSEASVHAAILAKMSDRGLFPGAIVDGPMALDVAISAESARIKGVRGIVAGRADVLLVPDVVCGNSIAKSMQYFAKAAMGGVIVGAAVPVVVVSRADTSSVKLNSLAIARCLIQ